MYQLLSQKYNVYNTHWQLSVQCDKSKPTKILAVETNACNVSYFKP